VSGKHLVGLQLSEATASRLTNVDVDIVAILRSALSCERTRQDLSGGDQLFCGEDLL